jgi:hypothetical protein
LTAQGHAIGLLASLETEKMREMIIAPVVLEPSQHQVPARALLNTVVVGKALASRLQRFFERQSFGPKLKLVGVFDSLAAATEAAKHFTEPTADILLWQAGSLQPGSQQELRFAQDAWRSPVAAVFYRFSSAAARAELTHVGAEVLSEPADDTSLRQWLASLQRTEAPSRKVAVVRDSAFPVSRGLTEQSVSPPLFDDTALTQFAGLTSAVACECPSHLAELLMQVTSFEKYSSECANRSAADERLHAYLQHVAGSARMLFEKALEQVAIAEGLPLPIAIGNR